MRGFNKVILMGNLTRDPQLRYLPSQTAVVDFGLAVNRKWRTPQGEDRDEVTFVDCSAFGKSAEIINQYCTKGKPLFVEGRLKYDTWEDKQGGGKRSKMSVVVENFQFLGTGGASGDGGGGSAGGDNAGGGPGGYDPGEEAPPRQSRPPMNRPASSQPTSRPAPAAQRPAAQEPAPFSEDQQFKEDDIPF